MRVIEIRLPAGAVQVEVPLYAPSSYRCDGLTFCDVGLPHIVTEPYGYVTLQEGCHDMGIGEAVVVRAAD